MNQRAIPLSPGFSTADAEPPTLFYDEYLVLWLTFTDWREVSVRVRFDDVYAIRWQMVDNFLDGEPYDGTCEIIDSEWIAGHKQQGTIASSESCHHFKLNFNAVGSFEVICSGFTVLTPKQADSVN